MTPSKKPSLGGRGAAKKVGKSVEKKGNTTPSKLTTGVMNNKGLDEGLTLC